MHLENIRLLNFKNYADIDQDFSGSINCLVGDNGSGKTNLLDAIHYLSFTKSAFNPVDIQNIRHGEQFFSISGNFLKDNKKITIQNSLVSGQRKKLTVNKSTVDKASDHIGNFPIVLITPNDTALVSEGSETRRKFFDSLLAQIDRAYLDHLINYHLALKQRNKLLKQFAERNYFDGDMLDTYDRIILNNGKQISDRRAGFCQHFESLLLKHFDAIVGGIEHVDLNYEADFQNPDYRDKFKQQLEKDRILMRTNHGVHRDDFQFVIDGYPLKKFGSQGQQKSFLIALKLAQFEVLKNEKGHKPLLLLDDIFDKLDDHRIMQLVSMIENHEFGQVFITDARPERTKFFLDRIKEEKKILLVQDGTLKETTL